MGRWIERLLPGRRSAAPVCAAALVAALGGCAAVPTAPPPPLADALFAAPAALPDPAAVMAVDPAMRRLVQRLAATGDGRQTPQQRLLDALYGGNELMLEYDARVTRNAAEAFAAKSGNCLSLVLMTAALARELGLAVTFNSAQIDALWRHESDLLVRSHHVNLTLGARPRPLDRRGDALNETMVDFLPADELRGLRTRPIGEATVLAMYFNNRAVETLAAGRTDDAYWFARAALLQDAGFDPALNTLAVVYLRTGHADRADRTLAQLLARDDANIDAIANLALVRDAQGRGADAAALRERRARLEPRAPLQGLYDGQLSLRRGDAEQALRLFEREISRSGSSAELQFWLAQAHFRLGHAKLAEQALAQARASSADAAERARFGAKIAWLREHAGL